MRALWGQDTASFAGDFVQFAEIAMYPKPVRPGGPPILIAGNSPAALERTARGGFTWLPNHARPEEIAQGLGFLKQLHAKHGTAYTGELVVDMFMRLDDSVFAAEESFPEALKALGPELSQRNLLGSPADIVKRTADYADAGVTALDLKPIYHSVDELLAMMQTFAAEVMPATA
jgi:alkanesulfonate monooxygenase SsuD/methylene tetrahydromethanopterin reductase-like flavin-dependent oxidoreductase (luciferase family)